MNRWWLGLAMALMLAVAGFAAEAPKLQLNEVQHLKLENIQLRMALLEKQGAELQAQWTARYQEFTAACEQAKTENKWDPKAVCDPRTLEVSVPKPPESPPVAPAPKK